MEDIFTLAFFTAFLAAAVRLAVPLMYAGLGEMIAEKAGILNIGMEGIMLVGAFCAFAAGWHSGSLSAGLLAGIAGGIVIALLHGFLSITLAQNQTVSGLAINMLTLGLTGFLYKLLTSGQGYMQTGIIPVFEIPLLSKIPVIGEAFFRRDILSYLLYLLVIIAAVFYKKTRIGMNYFAIGNNARAAESAGIPVHAYQWAAMLLNGILGGIGGAFLVLVQLGVFTENMIAGRGYIALACVILGRYTPLGVFLSALLFGLANAMQIRLQVIGVNVSPYLLGTLPYLITLLAMLGAAGKNSKPDGLGKPYIREER